MRKFILNTSIIFLNIVGVSSLYAGGPAAVAAPANAAVIAPTGPPNVVAPAAAPAAAAAPAPAAPLAPAPAPAPAPVAPPIPIDGGLSLLLIAGAAYGGKKIHDIRKSKNDIQ